MKIITKLKQLLCKHSISQGWHNDTHWMEQCYKCGKTWTNIKNEELF